MAMTYGSKATRGGGTAQQNASGTPGQTPNGGGPDGSLKTYQGQPTGTGEVGRIAPAMDTPNELRDLAGDMHLFPHKK